MKIGLGDIITAAAASLALLGYFVEVSKIKIKPLSALAKIFNAELFQSMDTLNDRMDTLDGRMDALDKKIVRVNERMSELQEKQEESEIKAARMRIQRFADEMYGNVRHSKEHFDLILMDITAYNNYCDTHPGFVNEKTRVAQGIIREKYAECLKERSFRDLDDEEAV